MSKRHRRQRRRRLPTLTCDQFDALYTPAKPRERVIADPGRHGSLPRIDARQRQPYIEARVVMGGATAVVVRMPMQASVPIGQAADAANISGEIRRAEPSVGSRQ